MSNRRIGRLTRHLARWAGDEGRTAEIRGHLDEAEAAGQPVGVRDAASVFSLVMHRAIRDLPWWLAGLPVPLLIGLLLASSYETHFHAWDVVGADEFVRHPSTILWMRVVESAAVVGVVAAVVAGRRLVQQLRRGNLVPPALFALAILVALSQADLFIERTAWWRDGRLRAEHVNDVSPHSLALFLGFTLLPVVYLAAGSRFERTQPSVDLHHDHVALDPSALLAAGLPAAFVFLGPVALVLAVTCTWAAPSISRRLKWATTAVVGAPLVGAVAWNAFVEPIDDIHPVVLATVLGGLAIVWFRIVAVAVQSLRIGQASTPTEVA